MKKVILHSDMNSCYASIEAKLNPKLRNIPLAVCGNPLNRNGIILAKSEMAKKMGVKTGEPIWQALAKCKDLTLVPPQYDQYLKHSKMAKKIYYEYTNQVESFGLDECFLDVTGSTHLFGSGEEIAKIIKERIKNDLGITVSIGVSFCKIFAKLGSDMKKPDAITIISEENFKEKVWPLDVDEMVGVGKATKRKLNGIGVFTLGDLANSPLETIKNLLGINGVYLWEYANGLDIRNVHDIDDKEVIKTIGNSSTCRKDLLTDKEVFNVMQELSFSVSRRLREAELCATGVEIFIRDNQLRSVFYQAPLPMATKSSITLTRYGMDLFKKMYKWDYPIRAVGIRAIRLVGEGSFSQMDVFSQYKKLVKDEKCDQALYEIRKKYGKDAITFLSLTEDIKLPKVINEIITLPNRHFNS